jgi:hypothetical protein
MYLLVNALCCYALWKVWNRHPRWRRLVASIVAVVGMLSVPELLGATSLTESAVEAVYVAAGAASIWWLLHRHGRPPVEHPTGTVPGGWSEVSVVGGQIDRVETTWKSAGPNASSRGTCFVVIRYDSASVVTLDGDGVAENTAEAGEMLFPVCGDNEEAALAHEILVRAASDGEPVDATLRYLFGSHGVTLSSGSLRTRQLEVTVGHLDMR